nr:hypothetical protein [Tanacetum cinerariifolium]
MPSFNSILRAFTSLGHDLADGPATPNVFSAGDGAPREGKYMFSADDCAPHMSLLAADGIGERIPRKRQNRIKTGQKGKRGEAGKSQKQLQWIKEIKLKKTQKEGPNLQSLSKFY